MRKNILFMMIFISCLIASVFADTVYLKNGRVIKGEILSETKYSVKIKVGKFPKVFYNDEVDRLEYAEKSAGGKDNGRAIVPQEISKNKRALILRLMKVNGAIEGIKSTLRVAVGDIEPERRVVFDEYLNADELIEQFIPIYAKYFTEEEIRELIRFYSSSVGRRDLEVSPKIMEDSLKAAVEYFKSVDDLVKPKF